jgi:hypothetical protein
MDIYRLSALLHILATVLITGLALFWTIMLWSLRQRFAPEETQRLLGVANGARWPHVAVPYALRIRLPWFPWLILALLLTTGLLCLQTRPLDHGALWWTKVALILGLAIMQTLLMRRPTARVIRLNMLLVLLVIVVSAWMIR